MSSENDSPHADPRVPDQQDAALESNEAASPTDGATAPETPEERPSEVSAPAPESTSSGQAPGTPEREVADAQPARPTGLAGLRIQIGSLRDRPATTKAPAVAEPKPSPQPTPAVDGSPAGEKAATAEPAAEAPPAPPARIPDRISPELDREIEAALGGLPLDQLIEQDVPETVGTELEPESQIDGRVVSVGHEEVFVDLGGRNQGAIPRLQFEELPEVGSTVRVVVHRFDPEDGLYEVALPGAVADVGDWSQVAEGMTLEAVVTGHNKGGLECQVGSLKAFLPMSQISLYHVDDVEEYVGQKIACVVTRADPDRRNLVISRRAVLEREAAEAKKKLWEELAVGQVREGVVRNLKEFGAFVDLGGVDGLVHISQLSWDRIGHPSEVLEVGQKIRVKIDKIDQTTGRISLAYRDLLTNPWTDVPRKYPVSKPVKGTVAKIMDFGALVKLEPGVAGLIHISELSHTRIWRVSDVVHVGQEVEVQVLSVDADAQRISLSLKALEARPRTEKDQAQNKEQQAQLAAEGGPKLPPQSPEELKGGLNRGTGGERFGLKW